MVSFRSSAIEHAKHHFPLADLMSISAKVRVSICTIDYVSRAFLAERKKAPTPQASRGRFRFLFRKRFQGRGYLFIVPSTTRDL
jgi:hypothetical protein